MCVCGKIPYSGLLIADIFGVNFRPSIKESSIKYVGFLGGRKGQTKAYYTYIRY